MHYTNSHFTYLLIATQVRSNMGRKFSRSCVSTWYQLNRYDVLCVF